MREKPDIEKLRNELHYNKLTGELRWAVNKGKMHAGNLAGKIHTNKSGSYIRLRFDYEFYYAHVIIFAMVTGQWAKNQIDHRDNDGLNNVWLNLREASASQNAVNRRYKTSTGYRGVTKKRNRFHAQITVNGIYTYLGSYASPEEAHAVYCAMSEKLHGEYARTQ